MRRKHGSKLRRNQELNVAPLIDVIFILVIFFMVTSTIIVHSGMKVKLPEAKNSQNVKQVKLTVYIDTERKLFLNEDELNRLDLKNRIEERLAAGSPPQITVKADKEVDYGEIIKIIDIAKEAGIKDISFATAKKDIVDYD